MPPRTGSEANGEFSASSGHFRLGPPGNPMPPDLVNQCSRRWLDQPRWPRISVTVRHARPHRAPGWDRPLAKLPGSVTSRGTRPATSPRTPRATANARASAGPRWRVAAAGRLRVALGAPDGPGELPFAVLMRGSYCAYGCERGAALGRCWGRSVGLGCPVVVRSPRRTGERLCWPYGRTGRASDGEGHRPQSVPDGGRPRRRNLVPDSESLPDHSLNHGGKSCYRTVNGGTGRRVPWGSDEAPYVIPYGETPRSGAQSRIARAPTGVRQLPPGWQRPHAR